MQAIGAVNWGSAGCSWGVIMEKGHAGGICLLWSAQGWDGMCPGPFRSFHHMYPNRKAGN